MREILFRGKRVEDGEWVEGYYYLIPETYDHFTQEMHAITTVDCNNDFEVLPETVGQYTGLTDKNGTKIFEGDIVRAKIAESTWNDVRKYTEVYVVTYHPKYCYFYLKREGNNLLFDGDWRYFVSIEKVVGNIHDNPKLI